jgi:hypothetical protein
MDGAKVQMEPPKLVSVSDLIIIRSNIENSTARNPIDINVKYT